MTRDPEDWKEDFGLEVEAAKQGFHPIDPSHWPDIDVIIHRMKLGDLMPLAEMLSDYENGPDSNIGIELANLLTSGYLQVKVARRGAPPKPDLFGRKLRMFLAYEGVRDVGSDEAFAKVAAEFGIGVETVRQAVTEIRRRLRSPKQPPPALGLDGLKDVARKAEDPARK
jgi:hypothetical protein